MSVFLNKAIVRIYSPEDEQTIGIGFLAAQEFVISCWHVVKGFELNSAIQLDFPLLNSSARYFARLIHWDKKLDVAILHLENKLPKEAEPIRLVAVQDAWGHPFRAFGIPKNYPSGVWAEGVLRAPIGDSGWLQIEDTKQSGYFIQPGFSGTPVWDEDVNGVVGMVIYVEKQESIRAAFCITSSQLLFAWPELETQVIPSNPYRGLLTFREQDARFFFGRNKFTDDLEKSIAQNQLTVLLGSSGIGKSSVIFAGLLPRLHSNSQWSIATLNPGRDPFSNLANALIPLLEPNMTQVDQLREGSKLATSLSKNEVAFPELVHAILRQQGKERLIVIIDQTEELYTLSKEETRQDFINILLSTLGDSSFPLRLLFVLRADFVSQAISFSPFADALNVSEKIFLGPMNRADLEATIVEPARLQGISFEAGLVSRLLNETEKSKVQLPLLEFALTQLWEQQLYRQLTHAAYETIGGLSGALLCYAEEIYQDLSVTEQYTARRLFIQLVQPGGEGMGDARRRTRRIELDEVRWDLARRLADYRLVVTGQEADGQEICEIAHEALIQNWERLQVWMEEDRQFRAWQERLRTTLHSWKESVQDDGVLLRGALLAEAEEWVRQRKDDIEEKAINFIAISATYAEIERMRWENLWKESEARRLAAIGQLEFDKTPKGPFIATSLGIQSLRLLPTLEGDQLLRRGLALLPRLKVHMNHEDVIRAVAFSPDGKWIISGSDDRSARVWEVKTGTEIARLEHSDWVRAVAFSPEGQFVATGGMDKLLRLWDVKTWKEVVHISMDYWMLGVNFSQDEDYLIAWMENGSASILDVLSKVKVKQMDRQTSILSVAFNTQRNLAIVGGEDKKIQILDWNGNGQIDVQIPQKSSVWSVAIASNGSQVATGNNEGVVQVWDMENNWEIARMLHGGRVNGMAFSPDGSQLITGSGDETARVWDVESGKMINSMVHSGWVRAVAFSPDGKSVVTGSDDKKVQIWEVERSEGEFFRLLHNCPIHVSAFSLDGQRLFSGDDEGNVRIWDVERRKDIALKRHDDLVWAISLSQNNKRVVSGSRDGTAQIWESTTGRPIARLSHDSSVNSVMFSPNGNQVVTGSQDKTVRVWDVESGREIACLVHRAPVMSVSFSPDGKKVISGSLDGTVKIWELENSKAVSNIIHEDGVWVVAISPDGRRIISGGLDGKVLLWDNLNNHEVAQIEHNGWVKALKFSSDGQIAASGSEDGVAVIWSVENGNEIHRLSHNGMVMDISFDPSGQILVTGSSDGLVRIWKVNSGQEVARMKHEGSVTTVDFSPDGKFIVSGSKDGTVRIWLWQAIDLIAEACRRLPRNLTRQEWEQYIGKNIPYQPTCPELSDKVEET